MDFSHALLLDLLSTAVLRFILGGKTGGGAMPTGCGLDRGRSGSVVKLPAVAGVFLGQGCLVSGDTLGVSIGIGGRRPQVVFAEISPRAGAVLLPTVPTSGTSRCGLVSACWKVVLGTAWG